MFLALLEQIVPGTVLILVVGWLARTLISSGLQREATAFKNQLERESEHFRHELGLEAHRQNTVFTRLHERRAEVIATLYGALAEAELATRHYIIPFGSPQPPDGSTLNDEAVKSL